MKEKAREIIGTICVALGVSTATEVSVIPFILMGIGLLAFVSGVTE